MGDLLPGNRLAQPLAQGGFVFLAKTRACRRDIPSSTGSFKRSSRSRPCTGERCKFPPICRQFCSASSCLPDARVLDVAAGSGLLARAFARRAKEVVAVDITPEMLAGGREAATREGHQKHHLHASRSRIAAIRRRLVRPRGDALLTPSHRRTAARRQRNGARRARTRTRALDRHARPRRSRSCTTCERDRTPPGSLTCLDPTWSQLQGFPISAGATIVEAYTHDRMRELEDWIDMSGSEIREELRAAFEADLAGGEPTGLEPYREDGVIRFRHPLGIVLARA